MAAEDGSAEMSTLLADFHHRNKQLEDHQRDNVVVQTTMMFVPHNFGDQHQFIDSNHLASSLMHHNGKQMSYALPPTAPSSPLPMTTLPPMPPQMPLPRSTQIISSHQSAMDARSVFVSNLEPDVTGEQLCELFQRHSVAVVRATIKRDRYGLPKGFAYVELATLDCLENALRLHGYPLGNRLIVVTQKRTNIAGMRTTPYVKPQHQQRSGSYWERDREMLRWTSVRRMVCVYHEFKEGQLDRVDNFSWIDCML